MDKVTPQRDLKLQRLKKLIQNKTESPLNPGNRKVLVFSAFADTARYLYDQLSPVFAEAGLETGIIVGGSNGAKSTLVTGTADDNVLTPQQHDAQFRANQLQRMREEVI
ncbi:SWF/SNF helicase family protein, partial [Streptococcus pneumoniae]|uniref:SWF/SNF helicase family protein n=1 Tax=Streptococcus pneumoniae TaxID=1313 RepID=UPI0013E938DA